ncbi:MAG: hypothetical protein BIFFINMI_03694 [Phycisphaerae bacterium]|nr:hypothetical protein [Phycisphaerae bacterium]
MKSIAFTFAAIVLTALVPLRADDLLPPADAIAKDHPRLLIRPGDTKLAVTLAQLKAIPRDKEFGEMLAQLRGVKAASARALAWRLTGDKADAEAALAMLNAWKTPDEKDRGNAFRVYFGCRDMALAYDWLHGYEGFTDAARAELRDKVRPLAEAGLARGRDHVFHNYTWMNNGGAMLWALATAGEDSASDKLYAALRERFNREQFPTMKFLDGVNADPMGYFSLYCQAPELMVLLAAQSATGRDLFAAVRADGDWMNSQLMNLVFATRPNLRFIHWGDMQTGPDGGLTHEMAGNIDALTWALDSPAGAFLGRHVADLRGRSRFYDETAILYFLYTRNLTTKPAAPPLAWLAGGEPAGEAYARGGWGDGDTIVALRCTDFYGVHNHLDQGSFVIYRNGPLAMDAGKYGSVGGHQVKTECHNTLVIDGAGQRPQKFQWASTLEKFKQRLTVDCETGSMPYFKDTPGWTAAAARFDQAYKPTQAKLCVRQFLFIRPATVVVVDRLAAPAGRELGEVKWLLNVPGKPEGLKVADGVLVAGNGKSWLRCRTLLGGKGNPTVEAGYPTPEGELPRGSGNPKFIDTSRCVYSYAGAAALTLVHLIEVGDGPEPGPPVAATAAERPGRVEVTVGGATFRFAADDDSKFRVEVAGD